MLTIFSLFGQTNATHVIYSNTLIIYPVANGNASFSIPTTIPLSCVYPLDTETSLDVAIKPQLWVMIIINKHIKMYRKSGFNMVKGVMDLSNFWYFSLNNFFNYNWNTVHLAAGTPEAKVHDWDPERLMFQAPV